MSNERATPDTQEGITRKIKIGKYTLYATLNCVDGVPAQFLIKASRNGHPEPPEGSPVAFLWPMAETVNIALAAGARWEDILGKWRGTRFEPSGLGQGTSPLDAIARAYMAKEEE